VKWITDQLVSAEPQMQMNDRFLAVYHHLISDFYTYGYLAPPGLFGKLGARTLHPLAERGGIVMCGEHLANVVDMIFHKFVQDDEVVHLDEFVEWVCDFPELQGKLIVTYVGKICWITSTPELERTANVRIDVQLSNHSRGGLVDGDEPEME